MEKFRKIMHKFLFPNICIIILLVILSVFLLVYSFSEAGEESIIAYISYFISAYTLTVVCFNVIPIIKKLKTVLHENKYTSLYINNAETRAKISLYTGFAINIIYSLFKLATGFIYHSVWEGAVAAYYIVLTLIRFILLTSNRRIVKKSETNTRFIYEFKSYRLVGICLFILNIAMSGMVIQMIWQNKSYEYPGTMIYMSALYTFYRFIISIVNIVKFRKINNPVFSAAKILDLAVAVMSIFALQTAMFLQFGGTASFQRIMNMITGGTVCLFVFGMAVFMIIHAEKELKKLKFNNM